MDRRPRARRATIDPLRRRRSFATRALLPLFLLLTTPAIARAQTPAPTVPSPSPAAVWIRPEEVAGRADALLQSLATVEPDATVRRVVARIESALHDAAPDLDVVLQHARAAAAHATSFVELEDLHRELAATGKTLEQWGVTLAPEIKRVAEVGDELQVARETWRETRARPETAAAGEVVRRRVEGSLAALAEAGATLQPWRLRVLAVNDALVERRTTVAATGKRLEAAMAAERENILVRTRPPFWQEDLVGGVRRELPQVPAAIHAYGRSTFDYVERDPRPLLLQIACGIVLVVALRALAAGAAAGAAAPVTERPVQPYALGALLVLLATPWFHPAGPQRFRLVLSMLALIPAARIELAAEDALHRPTFAAVFLILLVDRLTLAMAPLPTIARLSVLCSLTLGLAVATWYRRRLVAAAAPLALRRAAAVAVAAVTVALVAEIGGWSDLAALVGRGVMAAAIIAVFVHAAVLGLEPVVVRALGTSLVRRSRMLDRRRPVVRQRVGFVLRTLGVAFWATFVLRAVGLHDAAILALQTVLGAGFSVGALSLSVGAVLAFVVTLVAAMLSARLVTGILEEDVYPRAQLPRGVPFVLSTLARYAVYSFGFVFALAAAGIQLSQLTILLGGLGVGVGLGLQDLVKNFAAGLTLLLERRLQPGDIVQLPNPQLFGRVVSIGMRATLVRPWDGSEVVVPNGDLIASAITNWTLSDRLCRLEVAVGVVYGTDPERVIEILLGVARADERFLENPPPVALFVRFGESSLDFVLRAWTDKGVDERMVLTSALGVAVYRALTEAGIAIPFPQRDLHVASVAPGVVATLAPPRSRP